MRRVMVRYKVKADRAAENEQFIKNVFDQLKRNQPTGLRYATFKLDDGLSFVHIGKSTEDRSPLTELPAFKAFTAAIKDRCQEPPMTAELNEIGSYQFFGN